MAKECSTHPRGKRWAGRRVGYRYLRGGWTRRDI